MNLQHVDLTTRNFYDDCLRIIHVKNRDYNPDGVAFLEALQTAWESGITVEQDFWGRFKKQSSALRRYLFEGVVESEAPEERMRDVANYMALLYTWTRYRGLIVVEAITFVKDNRPCERGADTCISLSVESALRCERCQFLAWLTALVPDDSGLRALTLPSTPKPRD